MENQSPFMSRPAEVELPFQFQYGKAAKVQLDTVGVNRKGPVSTFPQAAATPNSDSLDVRPTIETAVHQDDEMSTEEDDNEDTLIVHDASADAKDGVEWEIIVNEQRAEDDPAQQPRSSPPRRRQGSNSAQLNPSRVRKLAVRSRPKARHRSSRASALTYESIGTKLVESLCQKDIKTKDDISAFEEILHHAQKELKAMHTENQQIAQLKDQLHDQVALTAKSDKEKTKLHEQVIKIQKNLKGVYGDMDYLRSRHTTMGTTVTELKQHLGQLRGNGRQGQASVKQLQSKIEKIASERRSLVKDLSKMADIERELEHQLDRKRGVEQQLYTKGAELTEERNGRVRLEKQLQNAINTNSELASSFKLLEKKADEQRELYTKSTVDLSADLAKQLEAIREEMNKARAADGDLNSLRAENQVLLDSLQQYQEQAQQLEEKQTENRDLSLELQKLKENYLQWQHDHARRLSSASSSMHNSQQGSLDNPRDAGAAKMMARTLGQGSGAAADQGSLGSMNGIFGNLGLRMENSQVIGPQPIRGDVSLVALAGATDEDEVSDVSETPNMLDPSSAFLQPSSTYPFAAVGSSISPRRPGTGNNVANTKSKMARVRQGSVPAEPTSDPRSPLGSHGVRTPQMPQSHRKSRIERAVREPAGPSSDAREPPHLTRHKRSLREMQGKTVRTTPLPRPQLKPSIKRSKSVIKSNTEIAAHFLAGGR